MLLSVMLLVTLMMIGLTLEAPRIAQQVKREKEEEMIHRGNEYKNAIRKYFRKFGQYPVSVDQLVNTNNMRFLRKRYQDPFTGKDDWRVWHVGEYQINPVNGAAVVTGQPGQIMQPLGSTLGQPAAGTVGNALSPSPGATLGPATGTPQPNPDPNASGGTPAANPAGITPASRMPGASSSVMGGGPIIGVSSTSKLKSIKEIKGKDHYDEWPPFVYDPRLEVQGAGLPPAGVNGATPAGGTTGMGSPIGGTTGMGSAGGPPPSPGPPR
jgi:type II secretory pathway pseudopilin PulG